MENRITDIGPQYYGQFLPPVIRRNYGKWVSHRILEPGLLVHISETGEKAFTVRIGAARLLSVEHIREICDIADKHADGYLRFTTRNNVEFIVDSEDKAKALKKDLDSRKHTGGSFKFPTYPHRILLGKKHIFEFPPTVFPLLRIPSIL